jgi:hypothetical protein
MAKTNAPAKVHVKAGEEPFSANARPDPYDLRDLEYRPRLQPLRPVMDARAGKGQFQVLKQEGQSCTGHAIAAVINTVLARQAKTFRLPAPGLVSPYMLYQLARRYDEFPGDADVGSSLRGAFKGWLRHGVALASQWDELANAEGVDPKDAEPDLDNAAFVAACRQRPLGAYYRVNAYRLDDMQSAINELHAIAVSAAIHRGWVAPVQVTSPNGEQLMVIKREESSRPLGGHAFCLVGYNEIGFLVQNSWGEDWGKNGFATLLYDDWLDSAYDAWVCRPGVPATPLAAPSVESRVTTSGDVVLSGGPNVTLLRQYVVNTGDDGRLSTSGKFTSSPQQIDDIFANMASKHDAWTKGPKKTRDILFYAHGGVIDEMHGLAIAQQQLGWWLKNEVYPVSFCWESGAFETIGDAIGDLTHRFLPFGVGFDLEEQADRLIEGTARKFASSLWQQMKGNAIQASDPAMPGDVRGATLVAQKLQLYRTAHPETRIHLAAHSAGTIFISAFVRRLSEMGIPIESVAFMGGAATNAQVTAQVLPAFRKQPGRGTIKRFTTFNLAEKNEEDDTCPIGKYAWYHKSLLYLVARGLEPNPDPATRMVPLIGLQLGLEARLPDNRTMGQAITDKTDDCDGLIVIAPTGSNEPFNSDAHGHADFDNDSQTMTSILLRMLQVPAPKAGPYRPNLPVTDLPAPAAITPPAGMRTHVLAATTMAEEAETNRTDGTGDRAGSRRAPKTSSLVVGATPADGRRGAKRDAARAKAPVATAALPPIVISAEAALAPQLQSPAFDMLRANGYSFPNAIDPAPSKATRRQAPKKPAKPPKKPGEGRTRPK